MVDFIRRLFIRWRLRRIERYTRELLTRPGLSGETKRRLYKELDDLKRMRSWP